MNPASEPETAVAERPPSDLATGADTPQSLAAAWGDQATSDDVSVANISQVHRTGKLCDVEGFNFMDFIYGGEEGVNLGQEIEVIFAGPPRSWFETDVDYDSDDIPVKFDADEEADAKQHCKETGDTYYKKWLCDVLVRSSDLKDLAHYEDWAPARMYFKKGTARATTGVVLRDLAGWLKGDPASGIYKMKGVKATNGKNSWASIKMTPNGKTPEGVRDFIRKMTGM